MSLRHELLHTIMRRPANETAAVQRKESFGHFTFHSGIYEKILPKEVISNLKEAKLGRAKLQAAYSGIIATAMQAWAIGLGATHFCHWFQPMTGLAAEKQDAFLDWSPQGQPIEKFSGKQLMRGEPDASSFPSGGLRSTAEARGYTTWDPTSVPFIWETGGTRILCLPALFFSWTGKALDMKIPLLRSEAKIQRAALRLLNLFGIKAESVHATLGCEQEYFLVDRAYFLARPDLIMTGRTLFGGPSPKGQELEDHYFGTLKERVAAFMTDLEHRAWALGIPLKTRHNEVAPNQFEAAPLFEKIALAVDHNILLMELMRQTAERHQLACLLHEKPFAGINGSGKHCNWSLSTKAGQNLLDPEAFPDQPMPFLVLLTAVLHAIYTHGALVRASIATPGNDHRLGGHEAPPPIISVYLGEALEKLLFNVGEERGQARKISRGLDLKIPTVPEMTIDETDRNRTSPFPFTGNKFEFRAVGSSQNPALPLTVLNGIVADSLNQIVDAIEKQAPQKKQTIAAAKDVIKATIKKVGPICFSGDNYAPEWEKEAKKRHLPIIAKSAHAFSAFLQPDAIKALEGILTKDELHARVEIMKHRYSKIMQIETKALLDAFHTRILPAAMRFQQELATSIKSVGLKVPRQSALLKKVTGHIERAMALAEDAEKALSRALSQESGKQHLVFCDAVAPACEQLRKQIDALELLIDDRLWPSPKYSEMLNVI